MPFSEEASWFEMMLQEITLSKTCNNMITKALGQKA